MKDVSHSETFSFCISEDMFYEAVILKNHLKENYECSDTCGICFECIDCALDRRWRGWSMDKSGNMVMVHEDRHIVKVFRN